MLTRRTATVTMSAPDASCACAITACDEYLPVPTMRRDRNVRFAIVKGVSTMALSATHEIDDLDAVAVADEGRCEHRAPDDHLIVLDGHAPRIDVQALEQLLNGHGLIEIVRIPVERDA